MWYHVNTARRQKVRGKNRIVGASNTDAVSLLLSPPRRSAGLKHPQPEVIHGSLLTYRELLLHAGLVLHHTSFLVKWGDIEVSPIVFFPTIPCCLLPLVQLFFIETQYHTLCFPFVQWCDNISFQGCLRRITLWTSFERKSTPILPIRCCSSSNTTSHFPINHHGGLN